MKLGFYYHTPIVRKGNQIFSTGYLGVFLDSLSQQVETLVLIMHEASEENYPGADYELKADNIEYVSLGRMKPAWHRTFFPFLTINKVSEEFSCDCILVRSPTPLATSFKRFFSGIPVFFMLVGDYLEGAEHLQKSSFRDRVIYQYLRIFDWQFTKVLKKSRVVVNSPALLKKYSGNVLHAELINTTTIAANDIIIKDKRINKNKGILLLYTGRIDPAKGLFELVESTAKLNLKYGNVKLDIVGWEEEEHKPVEAALMGLAQKLGISQAVVFHGRKKVGKELWVYYENADIYVLPSYHEGFPRTIWEAMAKGLPVVATSVGGIPEFLNDEMNCKLIQPRSVEAIVDGVEYFLKNEDRTSEVIKWAYERVAEVTLERQSEKLVKILKSYVNEEVV